MNYLSEPLLRVNPNYGGASTLVKVNPAKPSLTRNGPGSPNVSGPASTRITQVGVHIFSHICSFLERNELSDLALCSHFVCEYVDRTIGYRTIEFAARAGNGWTKVIISLNRYAEKIPESREAVENFFSDLEKLNGLEASDDSKAICFFDALRRLLGPVGEWKTVSLDEGVVSTQSRGLTEYKRLLGELLLQTQMLPTGSISKNLLQTAVELELHSMLSSQKERVIESLFQSIKNHAELGKIQRALNNATSAEETDSLLSSFNETLHLIMYEQFKSFIHLLGNQKAADPLQERIYIAAKYLPEFVMKEMIDPAFHPFQNLIRILTGKFTAEELDIARKFMIDNVQHLKPDQDFAVVRGNLRREWMDSIIKKEAENLFDAIFRFLGRKFSNQITGMNGPNRELITKALELVSTFPQTKEHVESLMNRENAEERWTFIRELEEQIGELANHGFPRFAVHLLDPEINPFADDYEFIVREYLERYSPEIKSFGDIFIKVNKLGIKYVQEKMLKKLENLDRLLKFMMTKASPLRFSSLSPKVRTAYKTLLDRTAQLQAVSDLENKPVFGLRGWVLILSVVTLMLAGIVFLILRIHDMRAKPGYIPGIVPLPSCTWEACNQGGIYNTCACYCDKELCESSGESFSTYQEESSTSSTECVCPPGRHWQEPRWTPPKHWIGNGTIVPNLLGSLLTTFVPLPILAYIFYTRRMLGTQINNRLQKLRTEW